MSYENFYKKKKNMVIIICAEFILLKLMYFYSMIGVQANFLPTVLISTFFIFLIFYISFEKRLSMKIPFIIYSVISVFMFTDVTYFSYFRRYLSISALGAAGMLGDVKESVFAVLHPQFLFLFSDLIVLVIGYYMLRKDIKPYPPLIQKGHYLDENYLSEVKKKPILIALIGCFALSILVSAGSASSQTLNSIGNQEWFAYHLRDITGIINNGSEGRTTITALLPASDTYEEEKKGSEFGIAEGKNLIVIQVEALQDFVIGRKYRGQEITPNLNKLVGKDSYYFNNYYQQLGGGNTSDAEFATNNSLYGTMKAYTYNIYEDNYFRGLPVLLKEKGYETAVFHAYDKEFWNRSEAYVSQGFDKFYSEEDYKKRDIVGMGLSDEEFFKQSINKLEKTNNPFYGFMITLSGHYPYDLPKDYGNLNINKKDYGIFGNYLQAMNYFDESLGCFIEELKESGLYDDSVIVIYGDHFGLNPSDSTVQKQATDFLGAEYSVTEALNIPLIIHIPRCELEKTVATVGGQVDFLPTIAYLMGFESLDTLYFGHNLLTVDKGFAAIQAFAMRGSFMEDNIYFEMSNDRVFTNSKAINIETGKAVEVGFCEDGYLRAMQEFSTSDFYLENDVLRKLYVEKLDYDEIIGNSKKYIVENPEIIIDADSVEGYEGIYCKESLDSIYNAGYRAISVNFQWTTDARTVLLKSWDDTELYFKNELQPCTYKKFISAKKKEGITPMGIEDFMEWLSEHEDVYAIMSLSENLSKDWGTKVMDPIYEMDTSDFYQGMKVKYGDLMNRIIPRVFSIENYEKADGIGYENILFSPTEGDYTKIELADFMRIHDVFGVILPTNEIESKYRGFPYDNYSIYLPVENASQKTYALFTEQ